MLIKVADLYTEVPEAGGMSPRCRDYLTEDKVSADIIIRAELYRKDNYPGIKYETIAYMESGFYFYCKLLNFSGLMLHSSAIEYEGRAYLFSGPSGRGKSTHTRLWQSLFGENARVFNDDKPALRLIDGKWQAYGTPWCGKDGININTKAPLAGICFLKRGEENSIRRLSPIEAAAEIISQTMHRFKDLDNLDMMISHVNKLVAAIPVYELHCLPNEDAARLSYETMKKGAIEAGL